MAEYIERAAAIAKRRKVSEYDEAGFFETYHAVPVTAINEIPAADVEPVVRCAKCVFRNKSGRCAKSGLYMVDRGFCSYGERGKDVAR